MNIPPNQRIGQAIYNAIRTAHYDNSTDFISPAQIADRLFNIRDKELKKLLDEMSQTRFQFACYPADKPSCTAGQQPSYKEAMRLDSVRRHVYRRDEGKCQICKRPVDKSKAVFHHRIKRSEGGKDAYNNLELRCASCEVQFHRGGGFLGKKELVGYLARMSAKKTVKRQMDTSYARIQKRGC